MSQNEIEKTKLIDQEGSKSLNAGAKKIDINDVSSERPSDSEKEKYKKIAELIDIWKKSNDKDADKKWEEFEQELENNRVEINSNK